MFGYAPAPMQLELKAGEAGWVICDPAVLPIRFAFDSITTERIPMRELARLRGEGDIGRRILFNLPTGCRIDILPETEQDRIVQAVQDEMQRKVETKFIAPEPSLEQKALLEYAARKFRDEDVDKATNIPADLKKKYYEYMQREVKSIEQELPLIAQITAICEEYLLDRSSQLEEIYKKVNYTIARTKRHAKHLRRKEARRQAIVDTVNTVGGVALDFIPVVGALVSVVVTSVVSVANAVYNSQQLASIAKQLKRSGLRLAEQQLDAVSAMDASMITSLDDADLIGQESKLYTDTKAAGTRYLLAVARIKYGIYDADDLIAYLRGQKTSTQVIPATSSYGSVILWIAGGTLVLLALRYFSR